MLITVVAILCNLQLGCVEEIVTDSEVTPGLTFMSCQLGERELADWMRTSPKYNTNWRLESWKCVPGRYQIRNRA